MLSQFISSVASGSVLTIQQNILCKILSFMRWIKRSVELLIIYSVLLGVAYATPERTILIKPNTLKGFTFSGYVDGSYNYLLRSNRFVSGVDDREYDLEPNGFTLQQAAITIAREPSHGLGGLFNVIAGRDANVIAPTGMNPNVFRVKNV